MNFKMMDSLFYVALAIVGIISLVLLLEVIYSKYKEHRELQIFRYYLKRGDKVKVKGMKDPQIVYTNLRTGKIVIDMYENNDWYKSVNVTDVYPFENEIEYEIVHE